ncbi:hypothetical protein ASE01_20100 [Nocardioides sp. Root190]|uniref:hypothetical protein n=1 Tax=Nocardioides sp. Root190 TaxID=1736488 RepID=UPI0006F80744|nr:hypothetical protein [Nocardioides sp. Root190]KRB73080.1 hypothetical protein ASE01_20100 [Nocardioides sp. Root190]
MSEYVSIRIDGLNGVVRDLIAMGLEVEDLKGAFSEIARFGAIVAARHAPRRTGRLAGDIRGNRARNKAVVAAGRTAVPYAGPINYGWAARGIQASGFMQRADDELQPYALRVLEQNINASIRARGLA